MLHSSCTVFGRFLFQPPLVEQANARTVQPTEVFFMPVCKKCNKEFVPKIDNGINSYCSHKCLRSRDRNGSKNPKWRGGRTLMCDGRVLIYCPGHPMAKAINGTYCLEYRLIMAKKLGRNLTDSEIVHHIDGDPTNNDLGNLEVMTQSEHAREHFTKKEK